MQCRKVRQSIGAADDSGTHWLFEAKGQENVDGPPLDEPLRVTIKRPLIGDEDTIEKMLFGRRVSSEDIAMEKRWALDAKIKSAALAKGYDSIVLMSPNGFAEFKNTGKIPRSLELNILDPSAQGRG